MWVATALQMCLVGKILAFGLTFGPDFRSQGQPIGWVSPLGSIELWACKEGIFPPSAVT